MPLLFAYTHILFTGTIIQNTMSVLTALVGTIIFSTVTMGFFMRKTRWYESILLAIAAFLAYTNTPWAFIVAITIVGAVFVIQKRSGS